MKGQFPRTLEEFKREFWKEQYAAVNEGELHREALLDAAWQGLAEFWGMSKADLEQIQKDVHSLQSGWWLHRYESDRRSGRRPR